MFDGINSLTPAAQLGVLSGGFGTVGALGAFILKNSFTSFSTPGIFVACTLIPAIAGVILGSKMEKGQKGIGVLLSYPAGVILANLAFRVSLMQPAIAFSVGVVGGSVIVLFGLGAAALAGISISC